MLIAERQDDQHEPQKTEAALAMAAILEEWGFDPDSPNWQPEKVIRKNGLIAELHKARKEFDCKECRGKIRAGTYYYSIFHCGSGVDPHPDRVHIEHLEQFFSCYDANGNRIKWPERERG